MNDKQWPTDTALALKNAVEQYGRSVYCRMDELREFLKEKNIPIGEIETVGLALTSKLVTDFFTGEEKKVTTVEANNLLMDIRRTGLNNKASWNILDALFFSIDIDCSISDEELELLSKEKNEAIMQKYIPRYRIASRLNQMINTIEKKDIATITQDFLEELNHYASYNIAEANYMLGIIYQEGITVERDIQKAKKYIEMAANAGSAKANALLGDYFFDANDFDQAYAHYSMPGAVGLRQSRRNNMNKIIQSKGYARKVALSLSAFYFLLLFGMNVWIARFSLEGLHLGPTIISGIFMTLQMIWLWWVHFTHPYKDLRHFGVGMLMLYMISCISAFL